MNYSIIRKILGVVTQFMGAFLLLPAVCGLCYGERQCIVYFVLAVVYFLVGRVVSTKKIADQVFYAREGFVVVGLSWIVLSILGAIPLVEDEDGAALRVDERDFQLSRVHAVGSHFLDYSE